MPDIHTVAQGEYLTMIAAEYGFLDSTVIWNHPNNAQLKQQRSDPNVLLPGDQLFIPDKEQKDEQGATSQRHTFTLKGEKLKLRIVLEDVYEKPVANANCTLTVDGQTFQLTTDGKGKLEQEIPVRSQKGQLIIKSDDTPHQDQAIALKIGDLDPVDSLTGQCARLNNLGYFAGSPKDTTDPAFQSAVEEFQCEAGITVDGNLGPETQAKLKQIHGC